MSMPSPFEMGRAIGGNVSGGISEGLENNRIDQILQQAQASGDPAQVQNIMNQIITRVSPEKRPVVAEALQNRHQQLVKGMQKQQAASYYQSQGLDPKLADLDPGLQKEILKRQTSQDQTKIQPLLTGLDVVNRQKELLKRGNLGPKVAFTGTGRKAGSTFSKQGIKDRAEYQRLGKSLISLATTIPIRNRLEFETLSQGLYDPNAKQEEIEGALEGMERIIRDNLGATGVQQQIPGQVPASAPQQPPAQMQPDQQQYIKGQTATNPQTGQTLTFNGVSWE